MNGCTTCGGFGDRHDPIAHDLEPRGCRDQGRGGDELDELASIVRLYMTNQTAAEKQYRAARMGAATSQERRRWIEWLADVGYGLDFTHHPHPPCTPREVAEVYAEREPIDNLDLNAGETSTEVHEWVITQNTGWEK